MESTLFGVIRKKETTSLDTSLATTTNATTTSTNNTHYLVEIPNPTITILKKYFE